MPVVKHLTKRQKKRMKTREGASANAGANGSANPNANENKSDKSQKKGSGGRNNAPAKPNPSANGAPPKIATGAAGAVGALERTPSSADRPGTTLPISLEMPANSYPRNSYNNYRYNRIRYHNNQREELERDQYYGRQPSNRVLGHLITADNYKRIQGAYERSRLWKLKRLQQANKRKREKQAAMAAAAVVAANSSKLYKTESVSEVLPEMAAAASEYHSSGKPPDIPAGGPEDDGRQMDLGPMSFQRYINGYIDWMFPSDTDIEQPPMESVPTVNPIGSEMLAKKQRLSDLAGDDGDPLQDAEDAVLRMAMQMDALQLNAMSPDDLERAVLSSGLDVSRLANRPTERANWMCAAILNILNEPDVPSNIWKSENIWTPGNCMPEPSQSFYPPLSASELHAQMDRALAQIADRPVSPIIQYPVQEPVYEAAAMPPPTYENTQMRGHVQNSVQAQIPIHSPPSPPPPPPPPPPPTGGNRRASNNHHIRGRNYYRGGKGRSWQHPRQTNRQFENNNGNGNNNNSNNGHHNNSRYSLYLQQSQFGENNNSNIEQPFEMAAAAALPPPPPPPQPVESNHHGMLPMGIPSVQNYGQYENMPYAPMGHHLYPGSQTLTTDPAANFVMPPPINQTNNSNNNNNINNNNSFAPLMSMSMPMPMNPNAAINGNNVNVNNMNAQQSQSQPQSQSQSQQQKSKKMGNKYSNWNAANPPEFVPFAGRYGAPYAPNYFTLSDNTHFPPLPAPLKNRQLKDKI